MFFFCETCHLKQSQGMCLRTVTSLQIPSADIKGFLVKNRHVYLTLACRHYEFNMRLRIQCPWCIQESISHPANSTTARWPKWRIDLELEEFYWKVVGTLSFISLIQDQSVRQRRCWGVRRMYGWNDNRSAAWFVDCVHPQQAKTKAKSCWGSRAGYVSAAVIVLSQ